MASSPSNMSPWPGVTERISFSDSDQEIVEPQPQLISSSDMVFIHLREQIASGMHETDTLLGAIAIAAQTMTDATGAALGLRRDGTVACVGRSGETAPALGARLSEDSGISGECLRNGRSQRCDDTETDLRVDAEVCRDLGLRSIAAVPIRSRLETVGILEVFSTSPQAFNDEHLAQLSSLAELADIASSTASADTQAAVNTEPNETVLTARPDLPILSSTWARGESPRKNIWRYAAAAGSLVLLGLLSVASWRMWNELRSRNETKPMVVQSAATTPIHTETSNASTLPSKPAPERIATAENGLKNPPKNRIVQAANIETEPDDGLIRNIPSETSVPASNSTRADKTVGRDLSVNTPPQVSMVSSNDDSLRGILAPATTLPKLEARHSEGVSPLVLEYKVMPAYPRQALSMRREGVVVMRAMVTDKGRISRITLLQGDPMLGRAAEDAIRQWRYHPALLNGQPTQTETDITINFKLP